MLDQSPHMSTSGAMVASNAPADSRLMSPAVAITWATFAETSIHDVPLAALNPRKFRTRMIGRHLVVDCRQDSLDSGL